MTEPPPLPGRSPKTRKGEIAPAPPPVTLAAPPPLPRQQQPQPIVIINQPAPVRRDSFASGISDGAGFTIGCLLVLFCVFVVLPLGILIIGATAVTVSHAEQDGNATPTKRESPSHIDPKLVGRWIVTNVVDSDAEPLIPRYHETWEFKRDGRLIINDTRNLNAEVVDGKYVRVYNKIGDTEVDVYACLVALEGDEMMVSFHAGSRFPIEFWETWVIVLELRRDPR